MARKKRRTKRNFFILIKGPYHIIIFLLCSIFTGEKEADII